MPAHYSEQGSGPALNAVTDRIRREYFEPSRKRLQSTLELLQSHQYVSFLAPFVAPLVGLFEVPLVSDVQVENLHHNFSTPQPNLLKASTGRTSPVQWADIARLHSYDPVPQEDGSYHIHIPGDKTVVKRSKFDHDMLISTIPRQMIDPMSYASDVSAEIDVIRLAMAQLALWKDLASQYLFLLHRGLLLDKPS
ncbi:hypothetical protein POX_f07412 [Penicillium oxalicum]|uniref:hypothetical protein n=1 Tax=Penicillium oxalicum TaxID=69781 RepID=UPI0020B70178|nr:hypothetical protein POX_f07412 [Penicillium oxalicum]KAI2787057.1 hypothetical protein POX_f07412 [Penicillium oxalicum]